MSANIPEPKKIKDLKDMTFYIPAYQRGYRWTSQEVGDLLDDINEFDTGNSTYPRNYCLQPLIVKERKDGSYEVVDGQQRLTTIFIFLKIAESITGYIPYSIKFETRGKSETFLSELSKHDGSINKENIDYYHITKAFEKINDWLDSFCADGTPRFSVLTNLFNKITNNVFFIWYIIPDNVKPVELFSRVNVGKIRLSNAELVKALIFNKDNFIENADKRQQELSLSWDRIERDLQKESIWYFLTEDEEQEYETRIDLIFDLLSDEYNEKLPETKKVSLPKSAEHNNRTFLIYYASYKNATNKCEFVEELWNKVVIIYERFMEWYYDLNMYHVVGFLIGSGIKIQRIFELTVEKKKSEIFRDLVNETKGLFKLDCVDELRQMSYKCAKKKLRSFFLLVNIATLVCKNEKQYRFPFNLYKTEKWDIEHIHATADDTGEADDSIGNLTLLLAKINRSYQDEVFFEKRKEILDRDRKGMFIPICTKNVFTKQYSENVSNMDKWEETDKKNYVDAMWNVLNDFWKGDFSK